MSRDWLLYLDDLIESAEKIARFLEDRAFEDFASNEMLFDAVLFNLEVIGEATKKLPEEVKAAAPEGDWRNRWKSSAYDIMISNRFGNKVLPWPNSSSAISKTM